MAAHKGGHFIYMKCFKVLCAALFTELQSYP